MKKNNSFLNLLINIIIPFVILTKFSKPEYLGTFYGLMAALALPLIYGLYELIIQKQKSFISIIGFVGILLTGIIGLLEIPTPWYAIKEASIPLLIGLVVFLSTKQSWQLITKFIYNRQLLNIDIIEERLAQNGLQVELNKKLATANRYLAYSFFISALLNYLLAKIIVKSPVGTTQFNEEIGNMTLLSFPVIALPSLIIVIFIFKYLLSSIKQMTLLTTNEILSSNIHPRN